MGNLEITINEDIESIVVKLVDLQAAKDSTRKKVVGFVMGVINRQYKKKLGKFYKT